MYKCPDVTCKETVVNYDSNNQQSIKWKVRYGTSHTSTPQGMRDDPNTMGTNNKIKKKKKNPDDESGGNPVHHKQNNRL